MSGQSSATAKKSTAKTAIAWGVILLIGLIWLIVHLTSGGGAKYQAKVMGYIVDDPATLDVFVQVKDTGPGAGTPTCTITAQDDSYAYHGIDIVTLVGSIKPGGIANFDDKVIITSQGAGYVTQAAVDCR